MNVLIRTVAANDAMSAYQWHVSATEHLSGVVTRRNPEFKRLAESGSIIAATEETGRFLGLIFFRTTDTEIEFSGLVVDPHFYNTGLGACLAKVAFAFLAGAAVDEMSKKTLTAKIDSENDKAPKRMLENFGFSQVGSTLLPRDRQLKEIEIFHLMDFDKLRPLASWFRSWDGQFEEKGLVVKLDLPGVDGFRDLADFVETLIERSTA